MRKTLTAVFLLALPTLAMAQPPHGDGPPPDRDELIEQIKEKYPEKWQHLKRLKSENPRKFHAAMMKLRRHMMMGEGDPKIMERMKENKALHARFKKAVMAYKSASDKDKNTLHKELLEMASELFDAKQAHRKRRLERAKQQITKLEEEIDERQSKRGEVIKAFVDDATGDTLQGL